MYTEFEILIRNLFADALERKMKKDLDLDDHKPNKIPAVNKYESTCTRNMFMYELTKDESYLYDPKGGINNG